MTDMERKTFFAALSRYGAQAQIMMVFEEMAELQDVLCKFLRGRVDGDTLANIAEEIADVGINGSIRCSDCGTGSSMWNRRADNG